MIDRIVNTLLTTPSPLDKGGDRLGFGFSSQYYFYLCCILSFKTWHTQGKKMVLVTDTMGKEMLVDFLGLPYDEVNLSLDNFRENTHVWGAAKVMAYGQQTEPFLHVDLDTFVTKKLPEYVWESRLLAQSNEYQHHYHSNYYSPIKDKLIYKDSIIERLDGDHDNTLCRPVNMGVFGGTDLAFIKKYSALSLEFFNMNSKTIGQMNGFMFSIIMEQAYLGDMAQVHDKKIDFLLRESWGVGTKEFQKSAHEIGYTHLIGHSKKNPLLCHLMESKVRDKYPEYYQRIKSLKFNGQ